MGESGGARSALHRTLSERAPLRTDTATSAEKERARSVLSLGAFDISYRPRERLLFRHAGQTEVFCSGNAIYETMSK